MPKRTHQTESQQAAAKRMREAAAEARRLRNTAADAAPVANPPAASFTGSSSPTVAPSAIAPADDLLPMAAPAAATPDGAAPAERRSKRAKLTVEASSAAAPVDSGTDPPPAGRFRRSCRTPTAQVPSNRPLRLLPLLRTA